MVYVRGMTRCGILEVFWMQNLRPRSRLAAFTKIQNLMSSFLPFLLSIGALGLAFYSLRSWQDGCKLVTCASDIYTDPKEKAIRPQERFPPLPAPDIKFESNPYKVFHGTIFKSHLEYLQSCSSEAFFFRARRVQPTAWGARIVQLPKTHFSISIMPFSHIPLITYRVYQRCAFSPKHRRSHKHK